METRKRPGIPAILVVALLALAAGALLAGCGGSSKPQYCSDRSTLEQSVNDLGNVKVLQSGGVKQLQSQLQKVDTDAKALASSAKSDYPSESSAIQSSVTSLKTALQGLPSNPSRQQLVPLATDVKAVVTAFQNFKNATNSKCS